MSQTGGRSTGWQRQALTNRCRLVKPGDFAVGPDRTVVALICLSFQQKNKPIQLSDCTLLAHLSTNFGR
jgi:hypothetical protein